MHALSGKDAISSLTSGPLSGRSNLWSVYPSIAVSVAQHKTENILKT